MRDRGGHGPGGRVVSALFQLFAVIFRMGDNQDLLVFSCGV